MCECVCCLFGWLGVFGILIHCFATLPVLASSQASTQTGNLSNTSLDQTLVHLRSIPADPEVHPCLLSQIPSEMIVNKDASLPKMGSKVHKQLTPPQLQAGFLNSPCYDPRTPGKSFMGLGFWGQRPHSMSTSMPTSQKASLSFLGLEAILPWIYLPVSQLTHNPHLQVYLNTLFWAMFLLG